MLNEIASLNDEPVRERALSPLHSFIVQAPAGSGKTELLTQRYLRLLATVKQPEQILAITFTRKAASEMSNRILQALHRANEAPRPAQAHHAKTWDLARAALAMDEKHQWRLLEHPSRLRIQTIDALNAGLSRRLPILSGTGSAFDVATDATVLYEAAAKRLLEQLGDSSNESVQLEVVLRHSANRVPALVDMLVNLLSRRDHWLPLVTHRHQARLRESIEITMRAAISHHLQLLTSVIPAECRIELLELAKYAANNRLKNGAKADQEAALQACSRLTSLPGTNPDDVVAWRGVAMVVCKQEGEFYSSLTKIQGFPSEDKEMKHRMEALLNAFKDVTGLAEVFVATHTLPAATYDDAQWKVLAALLEVLPQAVALLQLEFRQHGQVDFVELALRARGALGSEDNPTDLALALDMRLQHILVDEFQDTSITQMKLLQLLTAGWTPDDGRTLFCVGDPMQSIYRFRQAEVGLFLDMQTKGLPNVPMQPLQLRTNFRSSRPVIDWINQQFPYVLPTHNDSEQGAVSYSSSVCRDDAATTGGVIVHAAIDRSGVQEGMEIAQVVKQSLSDPAARIAILVGGRSHVNAIADALSRNEIAFNAVDIEPLKDRSLIQDLLSLTRALLHLGDRISWLACLRAPWCGLTLIDLHALVGEKQEECVWTLVNDAELVGTFDIDVQARIRRFTEAMNHALNERGRSSLRDWIQRCWMALAGPALLDNVSDLHDANAYFAHLDSVEVAGDVPDIAQLESQLNELYAAPVNSESARVEIMTIHKSKGLEFDVVIIPSMHRGAQQDKSQLLRWAQLTGLPTDGLVLSPPQARGNDGDSIYEWLKYLEQRRADLERGRLLYVAVTRAKRELHLFGSVGVDIKDKVRLPRKGTLLSLIWHAVAHEFEHCTRSRVVDEQLGQQVQAIRRLPLIWRMPIAADCIDGIDAQQHVSPVDEPIEFDWVSETSRHVGTVVHAELEALMNADQKEQPHWDVAARRPLINLMLMEQGVPTSLRDKACDRVVIAIQYTLADNIGRWITGINNDISDASTELAVSGVVDGVVVNCVMDRTFIDAQGNRWIVDFKTSTHEGGDLEAFLQSEELRYRSQLLRYATLMRAWKPENPVKTALYFPLLREWREMQLPAN